MIRTLIAAAVLSALTLAGTDAEAKRLRSHSSSGPADKPSAPAAKKAAKDDHDEKVDVKKANQDGGSGPSIRINSRESSSQSSAQSAAQSGAASAVPAAGASAREGEVAHKAAEEAHRIAAEQQAREARRSTIMSSPPTCVIKPVMSDADRAKCRNS